MNQINNIRSTIISKSLQESIETSDNQNNYQSSMFSSIINFKDTLKFNVINFRTKLSFNTPRIRIFKKLYNNTNKSDSEKIKEKLKKIIYFSYRNGFKGIDNFRNNKIWTSDCGWGCMVRSSQMLMARVVYKLLRQKYKENGLNKRESKEEGINRIRLASIYFFLDVNIPHNYKIFGMDNYISKLNSIKKNKTVISFDPPFSIQKIVRFGQIYERAAGEWFSDYELSKIYRDINKEFNIFPDLEILHFNSEFNIPTILETCFKENENKNQNNINNSNNNINNSTNINNNNNSSNINNIKNSSDVNKNNYLIYDNKQYLLQKKGLIFISLRLGISTITPDYFTSIKSVFDCKECVGILGGKENSATYFIGYYSSSLIYFDPHLNQQAPKIPLSYNKNIHINNSNNNKTHPNNNSNPNPSPNSSYASYYAHNVYSMTLQSAAPAMTIGFLFRNLSEFNDLLRFVLALKTQEYPCFYVKENNNINNNIKNKNINELYNGGEGDDF